MTPQWKNVPQWEEIPEPKKTKDLEEELMPGIPKAFLETEPDVEQVLIQVPKKRGRPKKGEERPKPEPIDPKTKFNQKIEKKIAKANRDIHRFRIQGTTEDGYKLYYVDHIVVWTLNKSKALQIYGKEYAKELARRIASENPRYKHARKFIKIEAKSIQAKDTNEKFYIENVYGDDVYFKRGYIKRYKRQERDHSAKRFKDVRDGNYKRLTPKDAEMLDKYKEQYKKMAISRSERTNAKRDKRKVRNRHEENYEED